MIISRLVTSRPARRGSALAVAAVVAGAGAWAAVPSASASAPSTLPTYLQPFEHCPLSNANVVACINAQVTSGSFTIGSTTLNISSPLTVQLGLIGLKNGGFKAVAPTDGTPVLSGAPIPVPIFSLPPLPGPLSITATTNLVSLPKISLSNLQSGHGVAMSLPISVSINNVLIGSGCTIGTNSSPVNIALTTGKTNPPAPNTPISGSVGTGSFNNGVITITGTKLVDNSFAVPGASGCGLFGVLDPVLNLVAGLPAAAGHNTAIMNATTQLVPASVVRTALGS